MKVQDHNKFRLFEYNNSENHIGFFKLGDVVINKKDNDIGVVIQIHENFEFRTDMFGNSSDDECRLATLHEIQTFRPQLFTDLILKVDSIEI